MSYKRLNELIQLVDSRNKDGKVTHVIGVSISKTFIPSVANLNGVDLTNYTLITRNQFACKLMSVGRDLQLPIDLYKKNEKALISSAYYVFEVIDDSIILPDYLNLWFRRPETDRWVGYISGGDVRGGISWDSFLEMEVHIPSIEKQREIVDQYHAIENKIKVNEQICEKLEATAQALYKNWFVDFEFPNEDGLPYKSSGGKMVWNEELNKEIPEEWDVKSLGEISKIIMGQSPEGESYNEDGIGTPLINGPVEFGNYFTIKSKWTTQPKKYCRADEFIMCVRGSTVGRHVISDDNYAIGRGVCSISNNNIFLLLLLMKDNLFEILKDVTGSTFPNLDRQTLENYQIIKAPTNIENKFESNFKVIFRHIKNFKNQNQKLIQLQDLLLSRLIVSEEVNV
jgi:type I restriction enzyme S subunit